MMMKLGSPAFTALALPVKPEPDNQPQRLKIPGLPELISTQAAMSLTGI